MTAVGFVSDESGVIDLLSGGDAAHFNEIKQRLSDIERNLGTIESHLRNSISEIIHNRNLIALTPSYFRLKNFIDQYARRQRSSTSMDGYCFAT